MPTTVIHVRTSDLLRLLRTSQVVLKSPYLPPRLAAVALTMDPAEPLELTAMSTDRYSLVYVGISAVGMYMEDLGTKGDGKAVFILQENKISELIEYLRKVSKDGVQGVNVCILNGMLFISQGTLSLSDPGFYAVEDAKAHDPYEGFQMETCITLLSREYHLGHTPENVCMQALTDTTIPILVKAMQAAKAESVDFYVHEVRAEVEPTTWVRFRNIKDGMEGGVLLQAARPTRKTTSETPLQLT